MFSGKVLSRNVDTSHKFARKYLESPGKWWLHKRYIICSETKECCNYNVMMSHTYYKGKYPQNWYHHIWRETNLQLHCGEVSSQKPPRGHCEKCPCCKENLCWQKATAWGTCPNHAVLSLTILCLLGKIHILIVPLHSARNRTAEMKKQG